MQYMYIYICVLMNIMKLSKNNPAQASAYGYHLNSSTIS